MKRLYLFFTMQIIVLAISANNYPDNAIEKAIEKVDSFYMCFKTIAKEKQGKNVSIKMLDILENYFEFPIGQKCPNEFNELGIPNDYKHGISLSRYVHFFREMFEDEKFKNVSFNYTVIRNECCVLKGIEFQEDKTEPLFARIVVHKTYSLPDSVLKIFSDTLFFNLENMKICQWTNDTRSSLKLEAKLSLNISTMTVKTENEKHNTFLSRINRKRKGIEL